MLSTTKGKKTKKHSNNRTRKGFRSRKGKVSRKKSKTGPRKRKTWKRPRTFHKGGMTPEEEAAAAAASARAVANLETAKKGVLTQKRVLQQLNMPVDKLVTRHQDPKWDATSKGKGRISFPFLEEFEQEHLNSDKGFDITRTEPNQVTFELKLLNRKDGDDDNKGICPDLYSFINESELKILASMSSIQQDTGKGYYGSYTEGSFLSFIRTTKLGTDDSYKIINKNQINDFGKKPDVDDTNVFDIIYLSKNTGSVTGPGTVIRILKTHGTHRDHPGYSQDNPEPSYSIISIWQADNIQPTDIKDVPTLKKKIATKNRLRRKNYILYWGAKTWKICYGTSNPLPLTNVRKYSSSLVYTRIGEKL